MNKKKLNIALWLMVIGFWVMQFKEPRYDTLDSFPYWISGIFLLISVCLFEKDIPEMRLLKPLCIINAVMDFFVWLVGVLEWDMPFQIYLPRLLSSVASLYINYQLITNLIQFAQLHGFENTKPLSIMRLARTIYITLFALFLPLYNTLEEGLFRDLVEYFGWCTVFYSAWEINRFRKDFFSYKASVERFSDTPKG